MLEFYFYTFLSERRTEMNNIAVMMPVIGAAGFFLILTAAMVIRGMVKAARISNEQAGRLQCLAEEMRHQNAEMKKDLQAVKEKEEEIDKMMKDV